MLRRRTPMLIVVAAVFALLVTTPAIVLDASSVRDWLSLQAELYARGRANEQTASAIFNAGALIDGIGIVAALTGVAGSLVILADRGRREWCVPVFVAIYFVVVSVPATHYERNMLPIVPYLAVAAGLLVARVVDRLRGSAPGAARPWIVFAGLIGIVFLALGPGLASAAAEGQRLTQADTRTVARDWILANIPLKTIVAREQYTPQLTPVEYRLRNHDFLWQRDWSWYRDQGVRYMITSSLDYARFYGNPDDPVHDAFYRQLFGLREVFRVDPDADTPGPTIRIFELPGTDGAP